MELITKNIPGLIFWGTKRGQNVFFMHNIEGKADTINTALKDIRTPVSISSVNKKFYSIEYIENKLLFSIYRTAYDVVSRNGYYAISIVVDNNVLIETSQIPFVLHELSQLYWENYIAAFGMKSQLSENKENPELFTKKLDDWLKSFNNKKPFTLKPVAIQSNAYMVYKDDASLHSIFENIQNESLRYKQLVLLPENTIGISCAYDLKELPTFTKSFEQVAPTKPSVSTLQIEVKEGAVAPFNGKLTVTINNKLQTVDVVNGNAKIDAEIKEGTTIKIKLDSLTNKPFDKDFTYSQLDIDGSISRISISLEKKETITIPKDSSELSGIITASQNGGDKTEYKRLVITIQTENKKDIINGEKLKIVIGGKKYFKDIFKSSVILDDKSVAEDRTIGISVTHGETIKISYEGSNYLIKEFEYPITGEDILCIATEIRKTPPKENNTKGIKTTPTGEGDTKMLKTILTAVAGVLLLALAIWGIWYLSIPKIDYYEQAKKEIEGEWKRLGDKKNEKDIEKFSDKISKLESKYDTLVKDENTKNRIDSIINIYNLKITEQKKGFKLNEIRTYLEKSDKFETDTVNKYIKFAKDNEFESDTTKLNNLLEICELIDKADSILRLTNASQIWKVHEPFAILHGTKYEKKEKKVLEIYKKIDINEFPNRKNNLANYYMLIMIKGDDAGGGSLEPLINNPKFPKQFFNDNKVAKGWK